MARWVRHDDLDRAAAGEHGRCDLGALDDIRPRDLADDERGARERIAGPLVVGQLGLRHGVDRDGHPEGDVLGREDGHRLQGAALPALILIRGEQVEDADERDDREEEPDEHDQAIRSLQGVISPIAV
jgi:hypothetical protein